MTKEKKPLFETMQFGDVKYAQTILDECEKKLARNKIGIWVAAFVPVIDVILGIVLEKLNAGDSAFTWWVIVAVVAYLIGGGLKSALKMVWKVTYWSWRVIPLFPVDLCIGACGFCLSGAVALFLPIVFVLLVKHQITMDRDAAAQFISCYRPAGV